jgi:hypothetical protein
VESLMVFRIIKKHLKLLKFRSFIKVVQFSALEHF